MTNYIVKQATDKTIVEAVIKTGSFSETIQYEFKNNISDNKIKEVYDALPKESQEEICKTKNGFKRFIRVIIIANPSVTDSKTAYKQNIGEAKRYASKIAKHLKIPNAVSLDGYITSGTFNESKYRKIFTDHPELVKLEDQQLVYVKHNGLVMVSSLLPSRTEGVESPRYIYVIFSIPTVNV